MFDISSLQYSSEFPGFTSIVITVLSSMCLGVLLAFTYEKTSRDVGRPNHFLQAMVLITIVSATVIQAIGDSVARGLGMIGALSIIRFRTSIRDTRNLVFMFASIVVGIATGVFGFVIAIVGTIGFCLTTFLLYYSSFGNKEEYIGKIKIELDVNKNSSNQISLIVKKHCVRQALRKKQAVLENGYHIYHINYDIKLKKGVTSKNLLENIDLLEGVKVIKFGMEQDSSNNI